MKSILLRFRFVLVVLGLAATVPHTLGQASDRLLNTFDEETSINGFWDWWGAIPNIVEWDALTDAGGSTNPVSGSVKLTITFDNNDADNQYCYGMSLSAAGAYNGDIVAFPADYSALEFDILWDTNNSVTVEAFNGSAGDQNFNMGFAGVTSTPGGTLDWGGGSISWISPSPALTGDGSWHHVSIPIALTRPGFAGLAFKKWQPGGGNTAGLSGTVTVWIDNIKLIASTAPPPPPTMTIEPNTAHGVQIAATAGGQYQRQSIAATSEQAQATWWIDNPEPVTYSLTLADMPANPAFQVHVFLSPDSSGANSPDWNDPNVVFLDIRQNADGTGFATFRYKTNSPNNNDMLYFQGTATFDGRIATLSTPAAVGTWSLKFQNNTNITLTGPGNASTNFNMLPEHAELFRPAAAMTASFGIQPNQVALLGASATFSQIQITSGTTTILNDTFQTVDPDQQVDPLLWTRRADDPNGITILTPDAALVVSWTIPDTGFQLVTRSNLTAGSWINLQVPVTQVGSVKRAVLSSADLPSPTQGFFQLINTNSP